MSVKFQVTLRHTTYSLHVIKRHKTYQMNMI